MEDVSGTQGITAFSTEAEDMYIQKTAVMGGTFTVPVDESGRWIVRFYTKTDAPVEQRGEYLTEKRTSTGTFLMRNERRRAKNRPPLQTIIVRSTADSMTLGLRHARGTEDGCRIILTAILCIILQRVYPDGAEQFERGATMEKISRQHRFS